jgi:hypothetical protein
MSIEAGAGLPARGEVAMPTVVQQSRGSAKREYLSPYKSTNLTDVISLQIDAFFPTCAITR